MTVEVTEEPLPCEFGLETCIQVFRQELPGWWFSIGECEVSCDASCAPTKLSDDISLIPYDKRFDEGFHVDLSQPSTLAEALDDAMTEALEARVVAKARFREDNTAKLMAIAAELHRLDQEHAASQVRP